jgi:hypothetical protein
LNSKLSFRAAKLGSKLNRMFSNSKRLRKGKRSISSALPKRLLKDIPIRTTQGNQEF